jgi:hypothetical protein
MKNLEFYLIALGVLIATAGQAILPAGIAVMVGVLLAGLAGQIANYLRKGTK